MAQNTVNFVPDLTGAQLLDEQLIPLQNNILTQNSGVERPAYAQAGTIWLDTTSSSSWVLKMFDGTDDITLGALNLSANTFRPSDIAPAAASVTPAMLASQAALTILANLTTGAAVPTATALVTAVADFLKAASADAALAAVGAGTGTGGGRAVFKAADADAVLAAAGAGTGTGGGRSVTKAADAAAVRAVLGSGTADSSTFLRGDGTWASATPPTTLAAVGSYAFIKPQFNYTAGTTYTITSGGSFDANYSSVSNNSGAGVAAGGVWRAMSTGVSGAAGLFVRVS